MANGEFIIARYNPSSAVGKALGNVTISGGALDYDPELAIAANKTVTVGRAGLLRSGSNDAFISFATGAKLVNQSLTAIRFKLADGTEITLQPGQSYPPSAPSGANIPATGDGAMPLLWLGLLLLAGAGLVLIRKQRRA